MTDNQYYYAVARIRSRELTLLNQSFIEQLLGAKSTDEALRLLQDKGWQMPDEYTTESDRVEKMLDTTLHKILDDPSCLDDDVVPFLGDWVRRTISTIEQSDY